MVPRQIRATKQQRQTIQVLRSRFAETGHVVVPLSRRFRRSTLDTVIVPKELSSFLFFVRPERDGSVSVRARVWTSRRHYTQGILEKARPVCDAPVRWHDKQLCFMRAYDPWYLVISRAGRQEIEALGYALTDQ